MSNMFQGLKRFWLFKNFTNLSIFTLFSGGTVYFIARYQNEKKFEHPVFEEALRLAEQNSQIVELIGFPVMLHSTARARVATTDDIINSSFMLRGPKGYLDAELAASSLHQAELQEELEETKKRDLTDEARKNKLQELEDYYVPDPKLLAELDKVKVENKEALEKTEIPKEALFWKIDYLYINVDKNFRVVIFPKKDADQKEADSKDNQIVQVAKFKPNPYKRLMSELNQEQIQRKRKSIEDFAETEEEIEEARKFRMNEMYRKIGYVRFYMFLVLGAIAVSGYVYIQKNRRKDLTGSLIHHQAMELIKSNHLVANALGRKIRFANQIRGAAIGDEAEFELDGIGESKVGIFRVKGHVTKKAGDWEIKEIYMKVKDQKGKEVENKKILQF